AEWVAEHLAEGGGVQVELVRIQTVGDQTSEPISAVGAQGLFTKEIQRALLDEHIDLAVHSLKDLPTELVEGLTLSAVPPREEPTDALLSTVSNSLDSLPQGARVGTGSRRRKSQLLYRRPDLQVSDIRGNVDTRLRKLDEGQHDAIVLAQAGLRRLGWQDRITQVLSPDVMLPAVGQGALGLEIRSDDTASIDRVAALDHPATHRAVVAERAMLAELRGGCLAPVGAWGRMIEGRLRLDGVVLSVNGERRVAASAEGVPESAVELGRQVAIDLIAQGADQLIAASKE
ncbi:MAG: hydroxymethylbilane synthase, partial [Pirellulaceae bacterium]